MGIYTLGPLLGPVIGPVAGGFLVAAAGYKWIFVVITALAGVSLALGIPLLEETYAPYIIEQRALRRVKDEEARGELPEKTPEKAKLGQVLWLNISRPFILLTRSIICFSLAAYMGLNYGQHLLTRPYDLVADSTLPRHHVSAIQHIPKHLPRRLPLRHKCFGSGVPRSWRWFLRIDSLWCQLDECHIFEGASQLLLIIS